MPQFRLRSDWTFFASPDRVWPWISDAPGYPRWWPGFARADPDDHGDVRCRVRGTLGLPLDFVQHITVRRPPLRLEFEATGDLVGRGTWDLAPRGPGTHITMLWEVDPGRRWLRILSRIPGLPLIMARSHHRVMDRGHRRLAALLGE